MPHLFENFPDSKGPNYVSSRIVRAVIWYSDIVFSVLPIGDLDVLIQQQMLLTRELHDYVDSTLVRICNTQET